nr:hypothetical protein BaRGS_005166 [Batillaria attramentaria]
MPVEEDTSPPTVNVAVHSLTMYNCSRPYTVPDSLKCDMIQQCLGGEDEPADCHYRSPGCGQDWIPYQDQCLKIVIDDALPDSPGVYCAREYEAQQAALISNEERNLVAYLASRAWSGTPPDGLKISIGFKKVRPQSPKLAHLYRYKWQWGEGGSPIAYEENQFQSVNKLEECAVLAVTEDHTVLTPYGEDENILKDNFTCPGYYRCYGSGNCVHSKHVCDGIPHCPNKDDERYLTELTELDLQDNPLRTVNKDAFGGLTELQVVRADDSRLCCSHFYVDQSISLEECDAPRDELSSCSDLLRTDFFRAFLWGLSILAIVGNAGVLIYRVVLEKTGTSQAYSVLVIQLSLSDFLMGVYLAIIGVADAQFRGDYVAKGPEWQDSALCKAAGFLALVSSEVSAFVICLITLDRLLVIRFPLISNLRLNRWSSLIVSSFVWAFGCTLAAIPLTQTSWNFYGQNGICLPLPITRRQFDGQMYAFGVFIILNFALFLFIGAGQALIFQAIRSSRQATEKDNRKQEIAIARRLFLIVMSDFCCWFPIGLMGLLASRGTAIPGEVNVWAAIFVLPLNSALNPFLYTLNTLLERRAREMVKKRIERLLRQLHGELRKWPRDKIEQHIRYCLRANLVKRETVLQWLTGENDGGDKPDGVQGEDPSCLSTSGIDLDLRSSQCI